MTELLAERMKRLGTETAFEVLAKARKLEAQGRKIVHLEIGEPDFDTPGNIVEAGVKALKDGWTHYGPSAGLPQVRETVAGHVSRTRGITVAPEQVVVTPGGKPIMFYTILALVNEGDEVICPNPSYPIYESVANFVGAKVVPLKIREDRDFNFEVDELESLLSEKTKLVVFNSPANPTGGVLSAGELERIAGILQKYPNVAVLSDEIYSEILYEGEHKSISSFPQMSERTVVLDGMSKTYAMTGWRLGYGVFPKWLEPSITRLMTNSNSCTASFSQIAMMEALNGPQDAAREMVAKFRERRDAIVKGLNEIPGFSCRTPKGAFYVFPNVAKTGYKSRELADMILNEGQVACLSGTCFGSYGEGYLRFSYANSIENINAALENLKKLSRKWAAKVG